MTTPAERLLQQIEEGTLSDFDIDIRLTALKEFHSLPASQEASLRLAMELRDFRFELENADLAPFFDALRPCLLATFQAPTPQSQNVKREFPLLDGVGSLIAFTSNKDEHWRISLAAGSVSPKPARCAPQTWALLTLSLLNHVRPLVTKSQLGTASTIKPTPVSELSEFVDRLQERWDFYTPPSRLSESEAAALSWSGTGWMNGSEFTVCVDPASPFGAGWTVYVSCTEERGGDEADIFTYKAGCLAAGVPEVTAFLERSLTDLSL